tara:strand:- start:1366 stop:1584 length:219 start_codon:yes stop_codon:yes gene_type:complete
MKQFTIEVSHASTGQLATIASELKIMSNDWARFGPRISINKQAVPPPALRITKQEEAKNKQAKTHKRHNDIV